MTQSKSLAVTGEPSVALMLQKVIEGGITADNVAALESLVRGPGSTEPDLPVEQTTPDALMGLATLAALDPTQLVLRRRRKRRQAPHPAKGED